MSAARPRRSALSAFRIDAMVVPTVLYGRHPGWGRPAAPRSSAERARRHAGRHRGQQAVWPDRPDPHRLFRLPEQVLAAAQAIDAVRGQAQGYAGEAARQPVVIVDPTLGDAGKGLYVPSEVSPRP